MATAKQRDFLAANILTQIGMNAANLSTAPVVAFLPIEGKLYANELMVIGRAVNGWEDSILPSELAESGVVSKYAENVLRASTEEDFCPMSWVMTQWGDRSASYNPNRSPFWRVIKTVIKEINSANVGDENWASHLVWSNLFKVAPKTGGNPSGALRAIQMPGCIALLQEEISFYCPRRLLFLTGLDYATPFLLQISPELAPVSSYRYVEGVATISMSSAHPTKVVIAAHPQGKCEDVWAKEVNEAFRNGI